MRRVQCAARRQHGPLLYDSDSADGEGSDRPNPVAWSMPDGFTLGAEPSKLDTSLVGKHIYMRWKD